MRKTYMANTLSEDESRLFTQCFHSDQSTKISYRIQSWPGEPFTRSPIFHGGVHLSLQINDLDPFGDQGFVYR